MDNPSYEPKEKNYGAVEIMEGGITNGSKQRRSPRHENQPVVQTNSNLSKTSQYEDLDEDFEPNIFGRVVVGVRSAIYKFFIRRWTFTKALLIILSVILYHAYLIAAIVYTVNYKKIDWCNNVGFLIILSALFYWGFFYYFVLKKLLGKRIQRTVIGPLSKLLDPVLSNPFVSYGIGVALLLGAIAFVVVDAWGNTRKLVSAAGIVLIVIIGLIVSKSPGRVKWRQVFWGIGLQFLFGLLIIRWQGGRSAFDCISGKVKTFLEFSNEGSGFVYSYVASGLNITLSNGEEIILPTTFYFQSLSVVFFFSFFISLLYHYGVMMWVIQKLGWFLQITIGTTAAESMSAAANIFVGQSEAPILIKPFLNDMTPSELNSVMTGGFATISGSVLGAYIAFGINPSYMLSSSIMAAPAALAFSKLIYPETKVSKTTADQLKKLNLKTSGNALDAASQGAAQAVFLVLNIAANIIAVMAFTAFLNSIISWFGMVIGVDYISFEWLLGKMFVPFAFMVGVDPAEVEDVALLLGLKTVLNEFVAYQRMVSPDFAHLSERSRAIATYALCSFANLSSIGIQLGGLGVMAPERRSELAQIISYSFIAGTACGLLNACMAGILVPEESILDSWDVISTTMTIPSNFTEY